MSRRALTVVVLYVALAGGLAHAQPVVPGKVPAEVVVLVESGDLSKAGNNLAAMARMISPQVTVPPVAAMVPMMLFHAQNPTTVDLSKPVRLVVLEPPMHTSPVWIFSVADADAYLGGIGLPKQGVDGGVHKYARGYNVTVVGKRAVAGPSVEAVKKVAGIIGSAPLGEQPLLKGGDVCAVVRLSKLMQALDRVGQNPFKMLKQQMGGFGPGPAPAQAAVMQEYFDTLASLVDQVDGLRLDVTFGQDALVLDGYVQPVSGGSVARYVETIDKRDLALVKYMPADAVFFMATKTGDISRAVDWYAGMLKRIMATMPADAGLPADAMNQMADLIQKWAGVCDGEFAWALSQRPDGLAQATAVAVKDENAVRELMADIEGMMASMAGVYAQFGMTMQANYKPNAFTHGGRTVDELQWDINIQPQAQMPPQALQMAQTMIKLMMGDGKAYYSVVDGVQLTAQGKGSLDAIKAMIDGKGRLAGSEALRNAIAGLPEKRMAVGYLDVTGLTNWAITTFKFMMPPEVATILEGQTVAPAPPLTFSATVTDGGAVHERARIPVAAAKALFDFVIAVRMGAAAGMQPAPPDL